MTRPITIGILAGMGPRSTAPFVNLVVDECQRQYGARLDEEFPHLLIYSLPTPFYLDRPLDHAAMERAITEGLQRLASCGVAFVAMPCNTAHAYYSALANAVDVPLLNIVEETLRIVPAANRVALLATRATIACGVYQQGLSRAGTEAIHTPELQAAVDSVITKVKANAITDAKRAWVELAELVRALGCQSAIIACTDLNAAIENRDTISLVDSAQALAAATVRRYLEMR